jgi:hypothetical protein
VLVTLIAEPLQHLFQLLHPHNPHISGRPATTRPPLNNPGGKRLKGLSPRPHQRSGGRRDRGADPGRHSGPHLASLPRRQHATETTPAYRQERQWLLRRWRSCSPPHLVALAPKGGAQLAGEAARATQRRVRGPSYPEDPIRRAYAQLLHQSASTGLPRPTAMTPQVFERRLGTMAGR